MGLQFTGGPNAPRLIKIASTAAFAPFGIQSPGVPIFLDRNTMTIEEAPTLWSADNALHRGRTASPNTWNAYADWLLDWLRHCDANGWQYLDVVGGQLGAYCRYMLFGKTVDGERFATATINSRINNTARFYMWLFRNRFIPAYPFAVEETNVSAAHDQMLAHAMGSAPLLRRSETIPVKRRSPKAISIDSLRTIRTCLAERDELIHDIAIASGPRLSEILALDLHQLPTRQ